jgi:hypothetical protein
MKPPVVFGFLLAVAGTIFFYGQYSKKVVVKVAPPPVAQVAPAAPKIVVPNLKVIPVKNGVTIRNARVQMINSDGIVFICDRGMVQALYTDLPPEFKDYYASKADPNSEPAQPQPVQYASYQQSPSYQQPQNQYNSGPSQESDVQREQDKSRAAERMAVVQSHISEDEDTIHRFETQSGVEVDPRHPNLTNADYQFAKANLEQNKLELEQLQNNPQN